MIEYQKFGSYLEKLNGKPVYITFEEIEKILGEKLPDSAYQYDAWWSNSDSHPLMKIVLSKNWKSQNLDLNLKQIEFYNTIESTRWWIISAGKEEERDNVWNEFKNSNNVGFYWNETGDLSKLTEEQIKEKFKEIGIKEKGKPRFWDPARAILMVKKNDILFVKLGKRGFYGIGKATDTYQYNTNQSYHHTIPVQWITTQPYKTPDGYSPNLQLNNTMTIIPDKNQEPEIVKYYENAINGNYYVITQNPGSRYNDVEGKQYDYDSDKAHYKNFLEGTNCIVQSKIEDQYYFVGCGKIGTLDKQERTKDNGRKITDITAKYSQYTKFIEKKIRTDEINKKLLRVAFPNSEGNPQPPAMLKIPHSLYSEIMGEDLGEDILDRNMGSLTAELLEDKNQVIFFGPPGTGKTRAGGLLAKSFIEKNKLSARDFELVGINKVVQNAEVNVFTDDEYQKYVLDKIKDEAQNAGFSFTQEDDSKNLYSLKKNGDEIRIGVNFSSSVTQNPTDVYLGVPTKMVDFLSKVPAHNRYQLIINCSVNNFILLPYEIKQKFARFVSGTESGKWDKSGKGQHAFHVTISNDTAELPVRDGTYNLKYYDCEKFTRNIKMMFGNFIRNITFHPSYSYEEFVEGIRPKLNTGNISYEIQDGIFKSISNDAKNGNPNNKYILFIDEINRGNISKIFGELITLIENDKRETHHSTLTYTKESFTVPKNLYIIGTMNTADKSLSLLDVALRRRFGFIELMPDYALINQEVDVDGEKFKLNDILENLNKKIKTRIGRERQIGHSYFMKNSGAIKTGKQLQSSFANEIIPLLQEYLYEDNTSLLEILGEGFVNKKKLELKEEWKKELVEFKSALKNIPPLTDND